MQLAPATSRRRAARPGFSLTELMIALVLVGIVGTSVTTILIKQQRFYRAANDLLATRSQIRQAVSLLPADLRSVSSVNGDIRAMSASMIDFDATIGGGVICQANPAVAGAPQDVYLLPRGAGGFNRLTGWVSAPQDGDRAVIYSDANTSFSLPLRLAPITGTQVIEPQSALLACPASAYLKTAADQSAARHHLKLDLGSTVPNTPAAVAGEPVRFLRRVRYSLTQAADDLEWYLGYEEFTGAGASTGVQIVSGPYRPLASDTTSGITFAYYNAAGTLLPFTATTEVARVDVVVRALTRGSTPQSGSKRADGRLADSDRFIVGLRN